jgi:5-methylcytosine-specific restriction enzyme A
MRTPLRYCVEPGCRTLVERGRCATHAAPAGFSPTAKERPRIRGRRLQTLRYWLFERSPLCVLCRPKGIVRPATIRDHIVPLAEGGADVESNTQALCQACSDLKTAEEARRGVRRWQKVV